MVTEERTIMKGVTCKRVLERMIKISARIRRGIRLVQNLLQRKLRGGMGEERMIQKENPSRLTAGKTNRPETADMTNPARPMLRKEIKFWRKEVGRGDLSSGRTRKL
jgi:hypothetical protein